MHGAGKYCDRGREIKARVRFLAERNLITANRSVDFRFHSFSAKIGFAE